MHRTVYPKKACNCCIQTFSIKTHLLFYISVI